ncbi:MAG TPA: polysaccharide biosynthesis tyrosine autokinase [Gemmatimonadales bacterium]|nr:polysaccharide biosynthesis tyrosine autokinase [Gemmatimonadales bacterium]
MTEYLPGARPPGADPRVRSRGAALLPDPEPHAAPSDAVPIRHVLGILRRRAWLIAGIVAATTAIGVMLALREPRVYRATAVLRMADTRRALAGTLEEAAPVLSRTTDPLLSLVQLLRSRSVIGPVVDSLGLHLKPLDDRFRRSRIADVWVDPAAVGDTLHFEFARTDLVARSGDIQVRAAYGAPLRLGLVRLTITGRPDVPAAALVVGLRDATVDDIAGRLDVVAREGTDVVDVSFTDPDPLLAQRIVNAVVQTFQARNVAGAQDESRRRRIFLAQQLAQTESLLARAQADLSAFRSRQQMASSEQRLEAAQTSLLALETRREALEEQRNAAASLVGLLRSEDAARSAEGLRALSVSPAIGGNPVLAKLHQQLLVYQSRLDSMTTGPWRSAPTNPDVVQLRDLVASARRELAAALSSQVTSLDAQLAALAALRRRAGANLERLPPMEASELRLSQRVDALSRLGDQLRQDYQKARVAEAVEAGIVEIVDLATLPRAALWTTGPLKIGLGVLVGLFLGGGAAFLLESTNTSFRRPEELESVLHVPGLAVIPPVPTADRDGRGRLQRLLHPGRHAGAPGTRHSPEVLVPFAGAPSVGLEAFRMLRTSLLWSAWGGDLKSLVVTSVSPGEGKTLTAANLAVTFAREGLDVLVMDCDLRRPRLHRVFGVARGPGLFELLESGGPVSDPEAAARCIRGTPIAGLSVLPCGHLPNNPSDVLRGARTRVLLRELTDRFDVVVVDTPPALATADATILGAIADGVLLVVRAGQTHREAAARAHQQLTQVGARVVGAVLNDPAGEVARFADYYYPYDYAAQRG